MFFIVCLSTSFLFAEEVSNNETNAAVLYKRAGSMLSDIPKDFFKKTRSIRENGWIGEHKEVEKILRENQAAIAEFKRATELENCDFTFGKEIKMTAATKKPKFTDKLNLAKLAILEGRLCEEESKHNLALKNYLVVLKFASHLNQQRSFILISKMVGVIIQNKIYPALEQYIKREKLSRQNYHFLLTDLISLKKKRTGLEDAFEEEKKSFQNTARMTGEELKQKGENKFLCEEFCKEIDRLTNEVYGCLIIAFKKNKPEMYEEKINQMQRELKEERGTKNIIWNGIKKAMGFLGKTHRTSLLAKTCVCSGAPVLGFKKVITKYYHSQAEFDIITIAVAIKLYESKKGKAPNSLSELTPDYLPDVFADPFNDFKPLKYKKENGGWIIYSFGPDKQDDNAVFECEDWDKKGDIIFSITE